MDAVAVVMMALLGGFLNRVRGGLHVVPRESNQNRVVRWIGILGLGGLLGLLATHDPVAALPAMAGWYAASKIGWAHPMTEVISGGEADLLDPDGHAEPHDWQRALGIGDEPMLSLAVRGFGWGMGPTMLTLLVMPQHHVIGVLPFVAAIALPAGAWLGGLPYRIRRKRGATPSEAWYLPVPGIGSVWGLQEFLTGALLTTGTIAFRELVAMWGTL